MRLLFVTMPWQSLEYPSLALGILDSVLHRSHPHVERAHLYANVRWAEYLLEQTGGEVTPLEYGAVGDDAFFFALGEWVFTPALYDVAEWRVDAFSAFLHDVAYDPALPLRLHRLSRPFVELLADEIVAAGHDVVAFTNTFMQNVPSLALAAAIKRRAPHVITIMGGGNCDGAHGEALHRNFAHVVDYVVRGEGEEAFAHLLRALQGQVAFETVPALSYTRAGASVSNPVKPGFLPVDDIPDANFDAYFELIDASSVAGYVQPKIVLESARGCWWGEKHHCKFCGLNGNGMTFRSKRPERVMAEVERAVTRYQTLDLIMVDNIMDLGYLKSVAPALAATGWDLRVHYEVKSNLSREQLAVLRDAKIAHIQPGIESLSSRVLKLMDKGVSGLQNVKILRDSEEFGLTVSWNYLYGFPGETAADYEGVLAQMPALAHLQPPAGASRIALERFSPFFNDPALGFGRKSAARPYHIIFDLPRAELDQLVYLFDTDAQGIEPDVAERMHAATRAWKTTYRESTLASFDDGEVLTIADGRAGFAQRQHVVTGWRRTLLLALERARSQADLLATAAAAGAAPAEAAEFVASLRRDALVFCEDDKMIGLAVPATQLAFKLAA